MGNFQSPRGDTIKLETTVTRDGVAADLTLFTDIWSTWKLGLYDADEDAVAQLKYSSGGVFYATNGEDGVCVSVVPADATAGLRIGTFLHYDVKIKDTDGSEVTVETGIVELTPGVTQTAL